MPSPIEERTESRSRRQLEDGSRIAVVGDVRIETPLHEKGTGAIFRGVGPRGNEERKWHSLDGHLLSLAVDKGASVIHSRAAELSRKNGRLQIKVRDGSTQAYDLLAVAIGVNTSSLKVSHEAEFGYGLHETTAELDNALALYAAVIPKLMKLAEIEKGVQLLAAELEKTRRRVNALEHILVPSLEETIRFISDRLSELERETATRLMKVKEMVRAH